MLLAYGKKLFITLGNPLNRVCYSGTRSYVSLYQTAMRIWGFRTVSTNPCGEIPLCPYDSCRLLAINLYSYVVNPFTPDAYFDYDLFKKHVGLAQRIMDDIIDLESEKIEMILAKIDSDPESMEVRQTERHLWEKIQRKTLQGRRTGVGITAEGDMIAALRFALWNRRSNRLCGTYTKDISFGRLSFIRNVGERTWCL